MSRCTYNGETDPAKPGKPIAFKELPRLWESRDLAGLFGTYMEAQCVCILAESTAVPQPTNHNPLGTPCQGPPTPS